ncbi:putative nucleosome assembly protein [Trypanosoma grayi]|uniref:putative nucleosome assembly protein n=1 Tax=Trypanosoma grayi TaxID=71804 RepID=UPI0004F4BC46|nr:putative nucleosome assembly protein [Trypanosoma grayi]KEG10187.1 putative nucleosome assembly protein [Trypanosoma grayi]
MQSKRRAAHEHEHEEEMLHEHGMSSPFEKFLNPNYSAEFMAKLPERIRQRAQVLMHYHEEYEKLRKSFEDKETDLRRKYDEMYAPLYDRRKEIVTGTCMPTEEEVAKGFPSEHEGVVDISAAAEKAGDNNDEKTEAAGLPGFWLRALQHHVLSASLIEEHDEPVLEHLTDVRSGVVEGGYGSFAVVFVFSPNEYFEEESLMLGVVQKDDGVNIIRSPLTWKPGKDVTVETITKKVGGKRGKAAKTTSVTVSRPSFFSMFKESAKAAENENADEDDDDDDDDDDNDEQIEQLLHVLHTSVIPCAVHFYTGEAPDGSSDIDTDEYDEDEEDEDEEEEEEPAHKGRKRHGGDRGGNAQRPPQTQDCKQQ